MTVPQALGAGGGWVAPARPGQSPGTLRRNRSSWGLRVLLETGKSEVFSVFRTLVSDLPRQENGGERRHGSLWTAPASISFLLVTRHPASGWSKAVTGEGGGDGGRERPGAAAPSHA